MLNHYDAWERPPIASVYAVYGVNMPVSWIGQAICPRSNALPPQTSYRYEYEDTPTEAQWYQVKIENENANEQVCNKTGDGTVPYHSLAWAHTWLGDQGTNVNITHVPQSVYFSVTDTKRFEAVRVAKAHQADYARSNKRGVCPNHVETSQGFFTGLFGYSARNHITFFEQSVEGNGELRSVSACGRRWCSKRASPTSIGVVDWCVGNRRRRTSRDSLQLGIPSRVARRTPQHV